MEVRRWRAYSLLAFAVARRWRNVLSNALEPGWAPTKMGGPSAPGDMSKARLTQAWLAVSDDALARRSGEYFYHQQRRAPNPIARDVTVQDELISECARISGLALPE